MVSVRRRAEQKWISHPPQSKGDVLTLHCAQWPCAACGKEATSGTAFQRVSTALLIIMYTRNRV